MTRRGRERHRLQQLWDIVSPQRPEYDGHFGGDELRELLRVASANGVQLPFLEAVRQRYQHEHLSEHRECGRLHVSYLRRVHELEAWLCERGLDYCFLKLKAFPAYSTNVDVLIPSKDGQEALRAYLRSRGLSRVFTWEYDKHMCVNSNEQIAVHVYPAISWYGVSYWVADVVTRDSRTALWEGRAVRVPSPEHDSLVHVLHAVFEQEHFTLADLLHLWRLQKEVDWAGLRADLRGTAVERPVNWSLDILLRAWDNLAKGSFVGCPGIGERFRERDMVRVFRQFLSRCRSGTPRVGLLRVGYAYGFMHVMKRLRILRG